MIGDRTSRKKKKEKRKRGKNVIWYRIRKGDYEEKLSFEKGRRKGKYLKYSDHLFKLHRGIPSSNVKSPREVYRCNYYPTSGKKGCKTKIRLTYSPLDLKTIVCFEIGYESKAKKHSHPVGQPSYRNYNEESVLESVRPSQIVQPPPQVREFARDSPPQRNIGFQPSTKPHQVMNPNQPHMNHNQPQMNHNQPQMNHNQPQMNHNQPQMNHNQPQMNHNQPPPQRFPPQKPPVTLEIEEFRPRLFKEGELICVVAQIRNVERFPMRYPHDIEVSVFVYGLERSSIIHQVKVVQVICSNPTIDIDFEIPGNVPVSGLLGIQMRIYLRATNSHLTAFRERALVYRPKHTHQKRPGSLEQFLTHPRPLLSQNQIGIPSHLPQRQFNNNKSSSVLKKRKFSEFTFCENPKIFGVYPNQGPVQGGSMTQIYFSHSEASRMAEYHRNGSMCMITFGDRNAQNFSNPQLSDPILKAYLQFKTKNRLLYDRCRLSQFVCGVITPPSSTPGFVDVAVHFLNGEPIILRNGYEYVNESNEEGGKEVKINLDLPSDVSQYDDRLFYQPQDDGCDEVDEEEDEDDFYSGGIDGVYFPLLMHAACRDEDFGDLKRFVEVENVDVLKKDVYGLSALDVARYFGQRRNVEYLERKVLESKKGNVLGREMQDNKFEERERQYISVIENLSIELSHKKNENELLKSKLLDLGKDYRKMKEHYVKTHDQNIHDSDNLRKVHLDMKRLIFEHEDLVLRAQRPGQILVAHDIEIENDKHFEYTKSLTDYLFHPKEPLKGKYDFSKFSVCKYSPELIEKNPSARFKLLLYLTSQSGKIQVDLKNRELFENLLKISDSSIIVACRNKKRFGRLGKEQKKLGKEGKEEEFIPGVKLVNLLMADCKVEDFDNTAALGRIYSQLPKESSNQFWNSYKMVDPEKFVKSVSPKFEPKFSSEDGLMIAIEKERMNASNKKKVIIHTDKKKRKDFMMECVWDDKSNFGEDYFIHCYIRNFSGQNFENLRLYFNQSTYENESFANIQRLPVHEPETQGLEVRIKIRVKYGVSIENLSETISLCLETITEPRKLLSKFSIERPVQTLACPTFRNRFSPPEGFIARKYNILVFGTANSGKTAMINSFYTLLNPEREICMPGRVAINKSICTKRIQRYEFEEFRERIDNLDYNFLFTDCWGLRGENYENFTFSKLVDGELPGGWEMNYGHDMYRKAVDLRPEIMCNIDTIENRRIHAVLYTIKYEDIEKMEVSEDMNNKQKIIFFKMHSKVANPIVVISKVDDVEVDFRDNPNQSESITPEMERRKSFLCSTLGIPEMNCFYGLNYTKERRTRFRIDLKNFAILYSVLRVSEQNFQRVARKYGSVIDEKIPLEE